MNQNMQAGFVLDLDRCVGCGACVLACRLENAGRWPGPARRLLTLNQTRHPNGPTWVVSVACHHCERPACARACPTWAYERNADGIVVHDETKCVGCRYCEMACPFGAPQYDAARGVVTKCDFCQKRMMAGDRPACVAACPTEALHTGSQTAGGLLDWIPGFMDVGSCRPAIRFRLPSGVRGRRLRQLLERMGDRK